jgi:hypothetical protein
VVDQGRDPGIRAALVELVKIGTTANQKRLFFNLRKVKGRSAALDDGDLKPDQITADRDDAATSPKPRWCR